MEPLFPNFFFVQRSFKVMPIDRIRNKKLSFHTCREKLENGHSAIFNLTISISTPVPMNLTHHKYILKQKHNEKAEICSSLTTSTFAPV